MMTTEDLYHQAVALLKQLIATPSLSGQEEHTAALIKAYLQEQGVATRRFKNNVWAVNKHFDPQKPTVMLNSHHDTVKPAAGYSRPPFEPQIEQGRLYGLGSNDAGGPLVSLIAAFLYFYDKPDLPFNILLAATAEEEISGRQGIAALIEELPPVEVAIVGEPTGMQMAIAEKGLLVLDCTVHGRAGHAAREEGDNAIYKAMVDIERIRAYRFPKVSPMLGPVKMTVTIIRAGSQHNVVPDTCNYTIDVRTTDAYTNEEIMSELDRMLQAEIKPRSLRLRPSAISQDHPLVMAGKQLGMTSYGSPTLSDQALIDIPSLKLGPGDSARSHTPDEYILLEEIRAGIALYIELLKIFFTQKSK